MFRIDLNLIEWTYITQEIINFTQDLPRWQMERVDLSTGLGELSPCGDASSGPGHLPPGQSPSSTGPGNVALLKNKALINIYGYGWIYRAPSTVLETGSICRLKASVMHDRVVLGLNLGGLWRRPYGI